MYRVFMLWSPAVVYMDTDLPSGTISCLRPQMCCEYLPVVLSQISSCIELLCDSDSAIGYRLARFVAGLQFACYWL
jgi:hypothetical protein